VLEDHFFFAPPSFEHALYGRTQISMDAPRGVGVVIVPPIGRERQRVLREMTTLGRDIAAAGFPVIRFDYRGEGESGGDFRMSTVSSRVADTAAAAAELRRRTGVSRLAVVGLHFGAVVAALAARQVRAEFLVCCDPVWTIAPYLKSLLRAGILQLSQHSGQPPVHESEMRARLRSGDPLNAHGYFAAEPFIDELEQLDLDAILRAFPGRSAVMHLAPSHAAPPETMRRWGVLLGAPSRCQVSSIPIKFSWTTRKRWIPRLGPLNDAVCSWLQGVEQDTIIHARGPM
jgi:pimeloyl-ACP methyl ester carboxylesterase